MSVVGIDIGNALCVIAAAVKGGVDVILNEESKPETPACVGIGARQRFLGSAAASSTPGTTIVSQIKRLIGRPLTDANLKRDLETLFTALKVSGDDQGYPLLHFNYRDKEVTMSPTQLLGMLLGSLKRPAERHLSANISDCCIAVPAYFNEVQRRAVFHAAEIAGLRPLLLINECSAAALEYGIYRGNLHVDDRIRAHVAAIVDVGHSATQVAIVAFRSDNAVIITRAADPNLGGRDFDEELFNHIAGKLRDEDSDLDVSGNARASARLRTACQKIKILLSANPDASLSIDCLIKDKDASATITREEFEQISRNLLERIGQTMQNALKQANLNPGDVNAVELIGSGSRVPAVVRVVANVFKQEPRRTLNASECVARGCALQAAMLSAAYYVKEFKIHERISFAVDISWKDSVLEEIPSQVPTKEAYKFNRRESTFYFYLTNKYKIEDQVKNALVTYKVGPFKLDQIGSAKFKVTFKSNCIGIMSVDSVDILLGKDGSKTHKELSDDGPTMEIDDSLFCRLNFTEEEKLENRYNASITGPSIKNLDTGHQHSSRSIQMTKKASAGPLKLDENGRAELSISFKLSRTGNVSVGLMWPANDGSNSLVELKGDGSRTETDENSHPHHLQSEMAADEFEKIHSASSIADIARLSDSGNQASHLARNPSCTEQELQVEVFEAVHGALELDKENAAWDSEVEETEDQSNALKSYVYEMRGKLHDKYKEYVSDADMNFFIKKLNQAERWLYGMDDKIGCGFCATKLSELKRLGDPIETRFLKSIECQAALDRLVNCISDLATLVHENRPEYDPVNDREKQKILNECEEVNQWLDKVLAEPCPKHIDPIIKVAEIQAKIDALTRLQKQHTTTRGREGLIWKKALDQVKVQGEYGDFVSHEDPTDHLVSHLAKSPSCVGQDLRVQVSELVHGVLSNECLKRAIDLEKEMSAWDSKVEETKDKMNALESHVYEMRGKLRSKYKEYVSDDYRRLLNKELNEAETWLYGEGENVDGDSYATKLSELKKLGDPIETRFKESLEWQTALDRLINCIADLTTAVQENKPEPRHFNKEEKQVLDVCKEAKRWLTKVLAERRPKHMDPIVKVAEIQSRIETLTACQKWYTETMGRDVPAWKKELELYACEMMTKVQGGYGEFVSRDDRKLFLEKIKQSQKWMNEEGEGADSQTYDSKLCELKMLGDPIEMRFQESSEMMSAVQHLQFWLKHMMTATDTKLPQNANIDNQEKQIVLAQIRTECEKAAGWLNWVRGALDEKAKYENPVVTAAEIRVVTSRLIAMKRYNEQIPTVQNKHILQNNPVARMYKYCKQLLGLEKSQHPGSYIWQPSQHRDGDETMRRPAYDPWNEGDNARVHCDQNIYTHPTCSQLTQQPVQQRGNNPWNYGQAAPRSSQGQPYEETSGPHGNTLPQRYRNPIASGTNHGPPPSTEQQIAWQRTSGATTQPATTQPGRQVARYVPGRHAATRMGGQAYRR